MGVALSGWLVATVLSFSIALLILSHSFEQWAVWPQVFESGGDGKEAATAALICAAQVALAVPVSFCASGFASSALQSSAVLLWAFALLAAISTFLGCCFVTILLGAEYGIAPCGVRATTSCCL